MGAWGGRRDWALGAAMALVLGGVAVVTLALREGDAMAPPEAEPSEPAEADGPPIEGPYAFLPVAGARPPEFPVSRVLSRDEYLRITLAWNPASRETGVSVGRWPMGVLDNGGLERCVASCREGLRAMIRPGAPFTIEIDAAPDLPWEQFVRAFAALRLVGTAPPMLSAGPGDARPDLAAVPPRATWGEVPSVLCATEHPVDREWGRRGALLLSVDPVRRVVLRFGADPDPEPHGYVSLRERLAAEATTYPDRTVAQLSRRRVALFLPPDAQWRHALFLLRECAMVGIWDIAFAVAAAPAPEPPK